MKKVVELVRSISSFLAIFIVILTVGYFAFLHYFGKYFPFPVYIEIQRTYVIVLAVCLFILFPVLLGSKFPILIRVVTLLLAIPFFCLFSYLAVDLPEQILDSAKLANHHYYITVEGAFAEPRTIYTVYKCNAESLECFSRYTDVGGASIDDVNLIVDEKTNEIYALRHGYLIYADGAQSHEVLESEQFENHIYYVGVYPPYGSSSDEYTYVLFKCESSFMLCQQLPFHYTDTGGSFKFEFDSNTKEFRIYQWKYNTDDILIYSLGIEPKCHVERCTIPDK